MILVLSVVMQVTQKQTDRGEGEVGLSGELRQEMLTGMTGAGSFVHKKDVGLHRWEEMPLQLMPKRTPPIFTWKGNGFQETGLLRFCRSEMPALGRETVESNANTHKETKLTFLKDKSEAHGGLCGPGEESTCKNLKKQPLCLSFQIYAMGIVKPHIS